MFWKKKQTEEKSAGSGTRVARPNTKKMSLKETIINQISQLGEGQVLRYQPREAWGAKVDDELAIIEMNPKYPSRGQSKYLLSTEKLADGKPCGEKVRVADSNKPADLASWLMDRKSVLFIAQKEPTGICPTVPETQPAATEVKAPLASM